MSFGNLEGPGAPVVAASAIITAVGLAAPVPPPAVPRDCNHGLDLFLHGQLAPEQLRIELEFDAVKSPHGWLRVQGNGVGNWNREQQFTLTADQMPTLAQAFQQANFTRMSERFGTGTPAGDGLMKLALTLRVW
jgi:hypothetical protein